MYTMEIDDVKKVFFIFAEGFFSNREGIEFTNEYITKTKLFNPEEFILLLDGVNVKASTFEVSEKLKHVMMLYMSVPFKKRIIIQQISPVANNQTQRLAREVAGFDTIIFVKTMEEALKLI